MPLGYGDFSALNDAEIDNDENSSENDKIPKIKSMENLSSN